LWRELIRHRQSDCLCRRFLFLVAFPAERDQLGPDCLVKGEAILDKHVKTGRINDRNGFAEVIAWHTIVIRNDSPFTRFKAFFSVHEN
jgi:hypothetical protein